MYDNKVGIYYKIPKLSFLVGIMKLPRLPKLNLTLIADVGNSYLCNQDVLHLVETYHMCRYFVTYKKGINDMYYMPSFFLVCALRCVHKQD